MSDLAAFYLEHCLTDPDFYDTPQLWDDSSSRFSVRADGWIETHQGLWTVLTPAGAALPDQGWKVHVSAALSNVEDVLATVWAYCLRHRLPVKFLRSRQALRLANSKYASRGSSGKFCAIYPATVDSLERTLTELGSALSGYRGPYILSDLRWRSGPLYVRYGAFGQQTCIDSDGEEVPALTAPDGRQVPDVRGPAFHLPSWVPVPSFLADEISARESAGDDDFPYQVEEAVHFSNAGGVYLARDPRTGQPVVLKEARPLAGLDGEDVDAVARLARERAMLERLSALNVVPRVLGGFTRWEHHFLVEEYIEGTVLTGCVGDRHPLAGPDPTPGEITAFTGWAVGIVGQVGDALAAIHERGVMVGDLHPSNVIVRADGRVVLVDLELARPVDAREPAPLGMPGFAAPPGCYGADADRYGLASLALWLFVPTAPVLRTREPAKTELFLDLLADRFRAPAPFIAQLRRDLRVPATTSTHPARHPAYDTLTDPRPEGWPLLRDSIADGILASATPEREDRLFPGDVEQFRPGALNGVNLANGAAGVLLSLARAGRTVDPGHVAWLARATSRAQRPRPGFYDGLHGIAYTLDMLGMRDEALSIMERAADVPGAACGLHSGLAGIGLNLLHFGDESAALTVADRLAGMLRTGEAEPDRPRAAGLLHGLSGPALFFLHCHRVTAEDEFLDLAATALLRDLDFCEAGPGDTLLVAEEGRLMPYLGVGTAGIGLVIRELLRHRPDDRLAAALHRIRRTCRAEAAMFPGLFTGYAGNLLCAAATADGPPLSDPAVRSHLRWLARQAQTHRGHLAFPGEQLFRLSMDLATGSAGVLLALCAVYGEPGAYPEVLPFLAGIRSGETVHIGGR